MKLKWIMVRWDGTRWSGAGHVIANTKSEARAKFKTSLGLQRIPPRFFVQKDFNQQER